MLSTVVGASVDLQSCEVSDGYVKWMTSQLSVMSSKWEKGKKRVV